MRRIFWIILVASWGGSLCLADEVTVRIEDGEVRLRGFAVVSGEVLRLEVPHLDQPLEFPKGTWKELVPSDGCGKLDLGKEFLSYYVSRARYDKARNEISRIRNLCPEKNHDSDFWTIYSEALDYLRYSRDLELMIAQVESSRINEVLPAFLLPAQLDELAQSGGAFDQLTEEIVDLIDVKASHTTEKTRDALRYDVVPLMIGIRDIVGRKAGLKEGSKKGERLVYDYWKERFNPRLEPIPWMARLFKRTRPGLDSIHEQWVGDSPKDTAWVIVDSGAALLSERAEDAKAVLRFGHSSKFYERELEHLAQIPVMVPLSDLPEPEDLGDFRSSAAYGSLEGCALQMYNAGPGRGQAQNCRVRIQSTTEYVRNILSSYGNPEAIAGMEDTFDPLIEAALGDIESETKDKLTKNLVKSLIYQESRFRPDASGLAGEKGLMQIMPATWDEVRFKLGLAPACPFSEKGHDPECNIKIGVSYLSHCLDTAQKVIGPEELSQ